MSSADPVLQTFKHFAVEDPLSESLDDRHFADAGFTDQYGCSWCGVAGPGSFTGSSSRRSAGSELAIFRQLREILVVFLSAWLFSAF
jgi:hypothetical protein